MDNVGLQALRRQVVSAKEGEREAQSYAATLATENATLREQLSASEVENARLREQVERMATSDAADGDAAVRRLRHEMGELRDDLRVVRGERDELRTELARLDAVLKSEVLAYEKQVIGMMDQLSVLEAEVARLRTDYHALAKAILVRHEAFGSDGPDMDLARAALAELEGLNG